MIDEFEGPKVLRILARIAGWIRSVHRITGPVWTERVVTKHHARKKELRRRMKETGKSYQSAFKEGRHGERAGGEQTPPLPNADRREDFINAVWDSGLPQMVKVLLYELASRLDLGLPDFSEGAHRVRFDEDELASSIGLGIEAANLCRYLAAEANWLVEVDDGVVDLREPHEDWDMYLGFLQDEKKPVADRAVYRSRLAAFEADTKRLRTERIMTIRRLREGMLALLGHTYVPMCVGGEFAQKTQGLGSGRGCS